ncbi:MAG: carboxypeptidase regulatory-like domain-containing protein [Candidatus Micrarchaeota archaeon]
MALLPGFAGAVPPQVCGPNGFYSSSINDCQFYNMPSGQIYCNGAQSKYHSTCVGTTYYDYNSYSFPGTYYVNGVAYQGQVCDARITYNDPRCGYTAPSQPSSPYYSSYDPGDYAPDYDTYTFGSDSGSGQQSQSSSYYSRTETTDYEYYSSTYYSYPSGNRYSTYGGYCGNGYCEFGESAYSCYFDCFRPSVRHYYPSCSLQSLTPVVYAGGSSSIAVNYRDLFYSPGSIAVNCGNGRVAHAFAFGSTGTAYAYCYYPNSGVYFQTAFAGGIGCYPSYTTVLGAGQSNPPQQPPSQSGPSCSSIANPTELKGSGVSSISIYYSGVAPTGASVSCGDESATVKNAVCSNGVCTTQCVYNPSSLPYYATINSALKLSNSQSLQCSSTFVSVISQGGQQPPQPPVPPVPITPASCVVISNPSFLDYNGSAEVKVLYSGFSSNVSSASVSCGNGLSFNVQCENDQDGQCGPQDCTYQTPFSFPKKYTVSANIGGKQCTPSSLTIFGEEQTQQIQTGGLVITVTDSSSNPVEGAFVVVYKSGTAVDAGHTNAAGVASFAGLEVSSYSITVSKTGFATETTSVSVIANQNAPVSIQLERPLGFKSCSVSLNPSSVRVGNSTTVQVSYSGFSSPQNALVSCSGQSIQAPCTGSGQGTCTTQCSFSSEQSYPQYKSVTASVEGTICSPSQATVIAPLSTQGTLLARVTDCESGMALKSASVVVDGEQLYTDSNGMASVSLDPDLYSIQVSKSGFGSSQATAQVEAGKTVSKSVCLNSASVEELENCDFEAVLVHSPSCPYSVNPQPYQVSVKNKNDTQNLSMQVSYSSNALTGPSSLLLLPSQQTIVEFDSTLSDLAGARNAIVSFASQECTRNIGIQACMSGGLSIEAIQDVVTALPGEKACFDLIVRNKGLASAQVVLSDSSSDSSLNGEFSQEELKITPQEIKNVEYCVKASSTGLKTFVFTAESEIGDATESVSLDVVSQSSYTASTGAACVQVDSIDTVENVKLFITNNGPSGDYEVELSSVEADDNELPLQAFVVQPKIYGFEQGSSRTITVTLNPFDAEAGKHEFELLLKKDGFVVLQQSVCFEIEGRKNQAIYLTPLSLTIQSGKSASAFLNVENQANQRFRYIVSVPQTLPIQVTPVSFTLSPGESEKVELQVTTLQSTNLGSYSIPVRLVTTAAEEDTYSVTVYCGSGQSKTVECEGGANSCSVSCEYLNSGVFTATASIGGETCASTTVRVAENYSNSCYLTVNPASMEQDDYATVTVNYRDLNSSQENFTVNCGNGDTVVAQSCAGTTGSCSAQCLYDSDGSFTATASSANYTCSPAEIAVLDDDGGACRLSTQTNVLEGASNTITLSYDVADLPGDRQILLGTQNLLVNVVSSVTKFEPQESQNIIVTAPSVIEISPGTSALLPVSVKNNDNFALNTVLVYLANLPVGVRADQIPAFSLAPGAQAARNIVLRAEQNAPVTSGIARLNVESGAFTAPEKRVSVIVRTASAQELLLSVQEPSFSFASQGNTTEITVQMPVTNEENTAITISAFATLPDGWRFGFAPVSIKPQETLLLEFKLATDAYDDKAFDAVISLQSDSKVKTVPMSVPSKSSATGLSGFFTALSGSAVTILMLLLIAGIALAAYLYYSSQELERKLESEEQAEKEKKR